VSNLGFYQDVTKIIKAVGGPAVAKAGLAVSAAALLVVGGAAHASYGKVAPKLRGWLGKRGTSDVLAGKGYTVHTAAVDDQGLAFSVDDTFTVIERHEDAVMIAQTGNADNPWAVSATFLARISDFPADGDNAVVGD
jgi:CTP:molybdopterin cytidylyltransferase MocA